MTQKRNHRRNNATNDMDPNSSNLTGTKAGDKIAPKNATNVDGHDFQEKIPRSEYMEIRKTYVEGEQQAYQNFDNAIITLSSAILGLTVTFTQSFIPNPINKEFLFASWISLIVALLVTLVSHITSQAAFRLQIENLDRLYKGKQEKPNAWDGLTAFLNLLAAVAFAVGIITLVYFGYLNLR